MRTDIDATLRAVQLACEFDWTWRIDDVARFCEVAGWTPPVGERSVRRMQTDLKVNHPDAYVDSMSGMVLNVNFTATDVLYEGVPYPEMFARAAASHAKLVDALSRILGEPTDMEDGSTPPAKRWDHSNLVIKLRCILQCVTVDFVNPGYQKSAEEEVYLMAKHGIS